MVCLSLPRVCAGVCAGVRIHMYDRVRVVFVVVYRYINCVCLYFFFFSVPSLFYASL